MAKLKKKQTDLVDPEQHGVLHVEGKLFRGAEGGEALDACHDSLYGHHLHSVRHHQSVYQRNMRTLHTHTHRHTQM